MTASNKTVHIWGLCAAGVVFLSAGIVQAQLIDVAFTGNSWGNAYGGGGPSTGPTQSGAAVVGAAGDIWNGIADSALTFSAYPAGPSASGLALNYANGSASGVTMSLTGSGTYNANEPGWVNTSPFTTAESPYSDLMQDLIFADGVQNITLTGLAANQSYNLVLYSAGDQNAGTGRTSTFTVNGTTETSLWNGTASALTAGTTYVDFPTATTDATGTLVIDYGVAGGSGATETDLNGFQLVPVPEPATWALLATAGVLWLAPRRKPVVLEGCRVEI